MSAGMGVRERRERVEREYVIAVFGVQEWFSRAILGQRVRPRGSKWGVVSVRALIRVVAVREWMNWRDSLEEEYLCAAWDISSMVWWVVRPSGFLRVEEWKSERWDWRERRDCHSVSWRDLLFRRRRSCRRMRTVLGRTLG